MNRRQTIKKLVLASGTLVALPGWAEKWRASDLVGFPSMLSPDMQQTLAAVVDTIIPAGNSIGALSVQVDKFLLKLLDECYEKDVQDDVNAQLRALDQSAHNLYAKPFKHCSQLQREEMLFALSQSGIEAEVGFFNLMKLETIRGFTTSREVMVDYFKFKQIPGHYSGCVDVNA